MTENWITRCDGEGVPHLVQRFRYIEMFTVLAQLFDGSPVEVELFMPGDNGMRRSKSTRSKAERDIDIWEVIEAASANSSFS